MVVPAQVYGNKRLIFDIKIQHADQDDWIWTGSKDQILLSNSLMLTPRPVASMSMTRKQGSFLAFSKSERYVVSMPAFSASVIWVRFLAFLTFLRRSAKRSTMSVGIHRESSLLPPYRVML